MICTVAARGGVCSVQYVADFCEWWFTSHWTFRVCDCQRGCWQICRCSVPSVCTHPLCLARDGRKGGGWLSLAYQPTTPCKILKDGCVEGGKGCLWKSSWDWQLVHLGCSWKSCSVKTSRGSAVPTSIAPVFICQSGLFMHSRGYFRKVSTDEGWFRVRPWLCTPPCRPPFNSTLSGLCSDRWHTPYDLQPIKCCFQCCS